MKLKICGSQICFPGHIKGVWGAYYYKRYLCLWGFPDGSVVKNLPANAGDAGDVGSIPG